MPLENWTAGTLECTHPPYHSLPRKEPRITLESKYGCLLKRHVCLVSQSLKEMERSNPIWPSEKLQQKARQMSR